METQANLARGMSDAEAERRARLALGGVQQLKEGLRDHRSVPWFDHLRQDVRYGVRAIALLAVTALAASGIPALRAASVDPLVALRDE